MEKLFYQVKIWLFSVLQRLLGPSDAPEPQGNQGNQGYLGNQGNSIQGTQSNQGNTKISSTIDEEVVPPRGGGGGIPTK